MTSPSLNTFIYLQLTWWTDTGGQDGQSSTIEKQGHNSLAYVFTATEQELHHNLSLPCMGFQLVTS
ncbi:hypothetical protein E2C01_080327 [Portunus trituberculatus]|uniref:Uncharacterized protein n=1 Tax=Portunus trituberculatus TaxID=210409 RepID=A0A5B7IV44_PORTR|nr:hypothetical protein [Portunus trituberculatus]